MDYNRLHMVWDGMRREGKKRELQLVRAAQKQMLFEVEVQDERDQLNITVRILVWGFNEYC